MAFGFDNILAFSAFAALIPLIIIYLIKPRPVKQAVPSLMFFIKQSRLSKKDTFFRHFQRDILFLLQLLAISLLAFSATQPYLTTTKDVSSVNTVFVLDVSASSHVKEGQTTRLEAAKEKIKELSGDKTTLILSKATPLIALQDADKTDLMSYLNRHPGTEEESSIGEAILLAGETITNNKGRVVVLSDFINTKGLNPETAKNILITKGIHVDFISTAGQEKNNVGIIKLVPGETAITGYVKNYNTQEQTVTLSTQGQEQALTIQPGGIETFLITPQEAVTEIILKPEDDFMTDNKVYVSKPNLNNLKLLLITNNKSKFVEAALNSLEGITLDIAEPPLITNEDYDVYIIHNINKNIILPGTFEAIKEKVKQGASVIIHAQPDSAAINYQGLNPLPLLNLSTTPTAIITDNINAFTRDIDFGTAKTFFTTDTHNTTTIASANGNTLISLTPLGDGVLAYYGILEKDSDFKLNPSYPLFWTGLINFLTDTPDLEDINLKTGTTIHTQDGTFHTLEKTGLVQIGDQTLAVNLLNEEESTINPTQTFGKTITTYLLEPVRDEVKTRLFYHLLLLGTLLVTLEFAYMKARGEV